MNFFDSLNIFIELWFVLVKSFWNFINFKIFRIVYIGIYKNNRKLFGLKTIKFLIIFFLIILNFNKLNFLWIFCALSYNKLNFKWFSKISITFYWCYRKFFIYYIVYKTGIYNMSQYLILIIFLKFVNCTSFAKQIRNSLQNIVSQIL